MTNTEAKERTGVAFEFRLMRAYDARVESTKLEKPRWTAEELERELRRFEAELRRAGLRESSVSTYVGRSSIFVRWLKSDYQPRGPIK